MKGKRFPLKEVKKGEKLQGLINAIRQKGTFLSPERKERIKEEVFASFYLKKSSFYQRAFFTFAFIFLFAFPALALLHHPREVAKRTYLSPSREISKSEVLERPFALKGISFSESGLSNLLPEESKTEGETPSDSSETSSQSELVAQSTSAEDVKENNTAEESGENQAAESQEELNSSSGEESQKEEKNEINSSTEESTPPPTPTNLTVLSGNLKNILSWEGEEGLTYKVYKSSSPNGSFTLVATVTESSFEEEIKESEVGYCYYRVSSVKEGKESTLTPPEVNEKVYIRENLSPEKETAILSSNGEVSFLFPIGAVSEEVTITIEENGIPHDAPNYTDTFLTSSYDFQPEGLSFLVKPYLSLAYIPPSNGEDFEKQWLSKAAKLYYYDKEIGVWLDVSDNISVNTKKNLITSRISHFSSYAGGYTIMPHGRYSGRANLCEVCHDTHDSEDNSLARRENVNLCYYCHGAPTSTLPSSGTHGPNVQAELIDANDQTYSGESTTETTTNLFSQTTQSEFNQDTLYHTGTTLTDDGEVILSNFNKNPLSDNFNDGVVDSKWTGLDISTSGGSENETDNPGRLTVYARGGFNGLRSGRTSDNFRFTYQTTSSPTNFDMRVKIESLGNVTGRDFAGLMIRDGTASNARYIAVGFSRERGRVTTYYRRNTGGYSSYVDGTINTFPVWVRIVKNGNTYTTYESTDGETWNQIASGSGNINNFNFGLATSAGSLWFFNPPPTTAVYDNFSVPNFDIYEYYTSGTVTSVEIIPSGNLYSWDTLSWSETLNGGDITIDVLGYNGSSWDTLKTGLTNPSGESLSDIDVSTYTRLKLVAHLTRGSPTSTPYLNSWQVSYTTYYTETPSDSRHPVPEREVLCADCHTPHRDPDDYPKLLFEWQPNGSRKYYKDEELSQRERRSNRWSPRYVGNSTIGNRFCWGCHGDWNNTKINSTYYANTRGDHKTNFLLTPHNNITWTPPPTYDPTCGIVDTTSAAINCLACHLKHGSSSSSNLIGYKGNDSSTYRGNGLCYACHKAGGDAPPSGYFVGKTEYELSAHGSDSNVLWPGGEYGSSYPAQSAGKEKQCVNCHNPHGEMDDDSQGNIYPKLCVEQTFTTSSPSDGGDLCFTCHDSTGPASDKKTEFSYTDSHHPIENGNPTCNNCHNPHLSDSNTTPHRVIVDPDDVTTLYPLADVPNPDDTSTPYPDTEVFCMDCHDGSWPGAPDISYELNNRTYDPSRTVSNFWYHHDHQPNRQCRRCHSGGGTAPFERIFNGHYTHAKVGGTGNTDQNASCTYCHDPHGTPGTDPSGVQRGKMLKSWIKVNAFPYEGTSEWNGRSGGSSPISCSLNDPTGACHNVTYIHNNKRDASNSGCSRTDCHSSF